MGQRKTLLLLQPPTFCPPLIRYPCPNWRKWKHSVGSSLVFPRLAVGLLLLQASVQLSSETTVTSILPYSLVVMLVILSDQ